MNTKTLSSRALSVLDQYLHFRTDTAVCSIPYANNKTARARAAFRTYIGKGSPQDISEEVEAVALKNHIARAVLADESLKKLLVDNGIGIDCSGFAYYVLNAENEERRAGALDRHISFVACQGMIGKLRCSLRPAENCDVATLAHDKNSRIVSLADTLPGDMITMTGGPEDGERDHVLIVHQVEYQNFVPTKIRYTHAVAYPEDGVYGTGVRQGTIEITDPAQSLLETRWIEGNTEGTANRIFARAKKSKTEIRRLKWWS